LKKLISIVGPTAVGKTKLSLFLARHFGTEILSTDSRQMYRGMDIGTAKASVAERALVRHHFIDILAPEEEVNAGQFEEMAEQKIAERFEDHDQLITVGGSTLYIGALWQGIDPMPQIPAAVRTKLREAWESQGLEPLLAELERVDPDTYQVIDRRNHTRVLRALEVYRASGKPISFFRKGKQPKPRNYQLVKIGLTDDRERLYARINQRVLEMVEQGLVAEVQGLLNQGIAPEAQAMQSIGYREIVQHLKGALSLDEAIALIQRNSRRYAKRQMTWFRKDEEIRWFKAGADEEVLTWLQNQ
jgi:tRNA dimethylallyltransferase